MSAILSSREKKIILLIIHSTKEITIQQIATEIGVSKRTVLREMSSIYSWFSRNGHELIKIPNKGLKTNLSIQDKNDLLEQIQDTNVIQYFTKHERLLFIITELLQTKDLLKLYYFASKLEVSEATISHDLNSVTDWLEKYDLSLERKQGFGVVIKGRERSKRKALINILYETLDGKMLKNVISNQLGLNQQSKNSIDIRNQLLNMIDVNTVKVIENVISESEEAMGFKFAESSYTALAVHLALAMQRIKNGERIKIQESILDDIKLYDEYIIANKLIKTLEDHIGIEIPDDETGYVTMHLKGARYKHGIYDNSVLKFNEIIISNYQLTSMINEMIRIAEAETGYDLRKVDSLLIGLVDHLRPTINRMQMNLDIRNPLLKKIKEEYPDIFRVSKISAKVITKHLGYELPESEIGYIAMHIGSAIEQIKNTAELSKHSFNIIVTCISGIGTSKMLAERIKKEFNNINIVEVFATTSINNDWLTKYEIDLIISTVFFENDLVPVISVNPLLLEKDIDRINQKLQTLSIIVKEDKLNESNSTISRIKTINEYSSAIISLLESFEVYENLNIFHYDEFLRYIAGSLNEKTEELYQEILKRERIGSIVFQDQKVIFLHARSEVVKNISVTIFRNIKDITHDNKVFNTALVLLAPKEVSKEKLEVIGEISSRVVSEESFLQDIKYDFKEDLSNKIEEFMNQFFDRKTKKR